MTPSVSRLDAMQTSKAFRDGLFDLPLNSEQFPTGSTHLVGMLCSECGTTFFPARPICPTCLRPTALQARRLSDTGTLYTFSIIYQAPPPYPTPYAIGYVDLPEGVRIFGIVLTSDVTELRVDAPVRVVLDELWRTDEQQVIGYKFALIRERAGASEEATRAEG